LLLLDTPSTAAVASSDRMPDVLPIAAPAPGLTIAPELTPSPNLMEDPTYFCMSQVEALSAELSLPVTVSQIHTEPGDRFRVMRGSAWTSTQGEN
jgi:hypothetical protein